MCNLQLEPGYVWAGMNGISEEIRCPSCSRLLVLRSGPAITPHFAHRPRQSCRQRPGRAAVTRLRLEQLTLFELEPLPPPETIPTFYWAPRPAEAVRPPTAARAVHRRRRRAWLPRLVRWIKARARSAAG
jgi:competence protein CoiA-like protein